MKKVHSQQKGLTDLDSASKYFERQVDSIKWIKNTAGLEEIENYFTNIYDTAAIKVESEDANNVWKMAKYQAEMSVARSFLLFLDNLKEE